MALPAVSYARHYSRNILLISYPNLRFARPWTTTRSSIRTVWEWRRKSYSIRKISKEEAALMTNLTLYS